MKKAVIFILVATLAQAAWGQAIINNIFDAINFGTSDMVSTFIENGTDVNQPGFDGQSPLHVAARFSNDPEVFRLLLNAGAEINNLRYPNATPFELILGRNNIEFVTIFINAGVDLHQVTRRGTPLAHAAGQNISSEILHLLVSSGASVTAGGADGRTPLHRAAGNLWAVNNIAVLLDLGADINAMDERGITPLMLASSIYQNVDVLIRAGANLNLQSDDGRTALMISAQFGADPRVIPLLLQHGADARLRDSTGRTALDWFDMNQRLNRHPIRRELWERTM